MLDVLAIAAVCPLFSTEALHAEAAYGSGDTVEVRRKVEKANNRHILSFGAIPNCTENADLIAINLPNANADFPRSSVVGAKIDAEGAFGDSRQMYFNTGVFENPRNPKCN